MLRKRFKEFPSLSSMSFFEFFFRYNYWLIIIDNNNIDFFLSLIFYIPSLKPGKIGYYKTRSTYQGVTSHCNHRRAKPCHIFYKLKENIKKFKLEF